MCGLFSAVMSSLRDSIHPPEMEIDPQKTACGSPIMCRGIENKNGHTPNPLTPWNAFGQCTTA